ncbi:uncharacterized protein LOC143421362 [Maylandia zebra]|uniref:uncharacterized protein LOC143421362 n=1 Tax=Maylandia zebra TaxID=106582 RepID=UPI00403CE5E5
MQLGTHKASALNLSSPDSQLTLPRTKLPDTNLRRRAPIRTLDLLTVPRAVHPTHLPASLPQRQVFRTTYPFMPLQTTHSNDSDPCPGPSLTLPPAQSPELLFPLTNDQIAYLAQAA